jgi:hypothetical protein
MHFSSSTTTGTEVGVWASGMGGLQLSMRDQARARMRWRP